MNEPVGLAILDTGRWETRLLQDAFSALKAQTGIDAKLVGNSPALPDNRPTDAIVDLLPADTPIRYIVECKSFVDRKGHIDQAQRRLKATGQYGLLVAPYISKELAAHCRAAGLQFIDTCGNAYLHAPGFLILISGEKPQHLHQSIRPPKGLTNAASLRVTLALLTKPELVRAPLKEIAHYAGVALGTAYNVLQDLAHRGFLINKESAGQRKLLDSTRLIDEWAMNYPTTLRAKLNGRKFTASHREWWKSFDMPEVDFAWGSEVAASRMTGYLKPGTQTLYAAPADMGTLTRGLVKQYRIKPDPQGEIEILEKFWHWQPETAPNVAPPLLVYSELLAILDPRARETADMIKERFVDPTINQF